MTVTQSATLTLAAGLATFIGSVWSAEQRTRIKAGKPTKPELARWEDEGGNVPEVATVSPHSTPQLNPAGRIAP